MPGSHIQLPGSSFVIQLEATMLWKAMEDGSSVWISAFHRGDPDKIPGAWRLALAWPSSNRCNSFSLFIIFLRFTFLLERAFKEDFLLDLQINQKRDKDLPSLATPQVVVVATAG